MLNAKKGNKKINNKKKKTKNFVNEQNVMEHKFHRLSALFSVEKEE